jgi:hypothetical protein
MGQVNVARINTSILLKYAERAELDPYSVSGSVSLALLEELLATASIIAGPDGAGRAMSRRGEPRANSTAVRSAEVSS